MKKPSKINVSLNPETMELLTKLRVSLAETLGFTPSYSQVIQHLIKNEQTDNVSKCSNEGVSNE
jgi:hypothetical protein